MYDLTSFLTTIAAASAGIVAILGGLIASKLISLNNDRTSAIERLKQIKEELTVRTAERDRLQEENDERDALDFIHDYISDLVSEQNLSDVYKESENPVLPEKVLCIYWEKAKEIVSEYHSIDTAGDTSVNADNIPTALATRYVGDYFCYYACQEIADEIKRSEKRRGREDYEYFDAVSAVSDFAHQTYLGNYQYAKNNELIAEQDSFIKLLELQRDQTKNQVKSLKKPKGMKPGLWIFAVFAVVCIILPLAFTPFSTENFSFYIAVKFLFLGLFVGGMAAIFAYLVYLLKWKTS